MTCQHCRDMEGNCVYPYYGVAPHDTTVGQFSKYVYVTRFHERKNWPANFTPDMETRDTRGQIHCGTYTHCLECGAPSQPEYAK